MAIPYPTNTAGRSDIAPPVENRTIRERLDSIMSLAVEARSRSMDTADCIVGPIPRSGKVEAKQEGRASMHDQIREIETILHEVIGEMERISQRL